MLFAFNLIMLLIFLFENTMSPIKIMAKTMRHSRSAMRVRASLFYDLEEEWTLEAISKIGFWLKVKAGPSSNPPRKHHGISDRHTQVCRGLKMGG